MNFLNKIGIGVSIISLIVIWGSLYYYDDLLSKNSQAVVEIKKDEKVEEKVDTNNIKVETKVEDNILVLTLENVSNRELNDVVLEIGFKGSKITDVYLEKFKIGKKTIKVPLSNKSTSQLIKDNDTIVNDFRLLEEYKFKVGEDEGYVLVTSIKKQLKQFYEDKIKNSDVSEDNKEKVLKALEVNVDYQKIENYFKKVGIIKDILLSDDTVKFNNDEDTLVIEAKAEQVVVNNIETQNNEPQGVIQVQPAVPVQPVQPAAPVVPSQPAAPVAVVEQPVAPTQP